MLAPDYQEIYEINQCYHPEITCGHKIYVVTRLRAGSKKSPIPEDCLAYHMDYESNADCHRLGNFPLGFFTRPPEFNAANNFYEKIIFDL